MLQKHRTALTHRLPPKLSPELRSVLLGYHRATGFWSLIGDLSVTVLAVGALVMGCLAFDRLVDVDGVWRAPLPLLALALLSVLLLRALIRLLRRPDYDRIAGTLDRKSGDGRDHLRTALDFHYHHAASFFVQSSCRAAAARWQGTGHKPFVERRSARRLGAAAIALAVIVLALARVPQLRAGLLWQRFLDPTGNYMRPSATWFDVENAPGATLRTGDGLPIRARLEGREVPSPSPLLKVVYADGTSLTRGLERNAHGVWETELKNLRQGFEWFLFMQEARSERYHTLVLPRPTVTRATVTYSYPSYTRMKAKTEVLKGRTITALAGTRIKLKIKTNVGLASALGRTEEDAFRFRISRRDPTEALLHLIITKNQKIGLDLLSEGNVKSKQELPFITRAIADHVPSISIRSQLDGKSFFVTDILEIDYRSQDDLGLSEILISGRAPKVRHQDRAAVTIDVDLKDYGSRVAEGRIRLPVAELLPASVDRLLLRMTARDTKDQEGSSRTVTLKIATDSFDRQLRFLLKTYKGKRNTPHEERGEPSLSNHQNLLHALKAARGKLAILVDILDENEALGEDHAETVKQVEAELNRIGYGLTYGSYWFFDFQSAALLPRFRRYGEYAASWSRLALHGTRLRHDFTRAARSTNPKAELAKLLPLLAQAISSQARISERVKTDCLAVVRELVGYLISSLEGHVAGAHEKSWDDPAFVTNLRETLREVIDRIEADLPDECPAAALTALKEALGSDDPRLAFPAVVGTLRERRRSFAQTAREVVRARASGPEILRGSLLAAAPSSPALVSPLGAGLYLCADNFMEDDLFVLQAAYRFLHTYTGGPGPFQPLGHPDTAARQRQESTFGLFHHLQRMRARAEEFRLGLVTGSHRRGKPEFDAQWLDLRECRFALMQCLGQPVHRGAEYREKLGAIVSTCEILESWHAPPDLTIPALATRLARCERLCTDLSSPLMPKVRSLLAKLHRDLSARNSQLRTAADALRRDMRDEMVRLQEEKDPRSLGGMRAIKVRLKAIHVAVLKTLDFVQFAHVCGAESSVNLEPLLAQHLLVGKAIQDFERTIESRSIHVFHHFRDHHLKAWLGKVREYEKLEKSLAALSQFLATPDRGAMQALLKGEHVSHQFGQELQTALAALGMEDRLKDTETLLADLAADQRGASAAWAEIFYQLSMIREALRSGTDGRTTRGRATALAAILRRFGEVPKELKASAEFLADFQKPSLDREDLRELLHRSESLVEEVRPIALPPERGTTQYVKEFYGWFQTIDLSALIRAKIRSQAQVDRDEQMVKRALVGAALQLRAAPHASLTWAVGESEWNRRKASMTLNRTGLGGIALVGDGLDDLKLPKHLYLELKRARAGAMPMLFKEECYDYLNRVLKKAR